MEAILRYLQSEETREAAVSYLAEHIGMYREICQERQIERFAILAYNQFVKECVQSNQYVSLSNPTLRKIRQIYRDLVLALRDFSHQPFDLAKLDEIVIHHRKRLIDALQSDIKEEHLPNAYIPCSEYTGEFQSKILRLDSLVLKEPILDVGCGANYELVRYLRKQGYRQVYGIDQYESDDPAIQCTNWFDYKWEETAWGTIIAHMSFSNHLRHVLAQEPDHQDQYIGLYHRMLASLRMGGIFLYTPSVRSVEDLLDDESYEVYYFQNTEDRDLDTVYIRKLCQR